MSQERRNDFSRAFRIMLAKRRCQGHTLRCFLDELPWELMPAHARRPRTAGAVQTGLIVNASFRYARRGEAPPEIALHAPPMDGLLRGVPLAWLEDAGTGMWAPFWVRGEWVEVLESLRPGEPAPNALPPRAREILASVEVLVAPDSERTQRARWERICRDAGGQFQRQGYTVVRNLIHPLHIGAMRQYYRALVASGGLPQGDSQVPERYQLHSEPVAMFFHPQLTRVVSQLAGEAAKPSYIYFASYPAGSALPAHVDRPQCEFSISLLVDYSPDPDGPCGWPIVLEHPRLPDGRVAVDLAVGDALFYRGRELVHSRDRLPAGHQSSSIFFHYVREDYVGNPL